MYLLSSGPNTYNENETIAKYEIMDGAPVRGTLSLSLMCYNNMLVFLKYTYELFKFQ